jgi:hypothetical protein
VVIVNFGCDQSGQIALGKLLIIVKNLTVRKDKLVN